MRFIVRNLSLSGPISLARGVPASDGATAIYRFRSLVAEGELEPRAEGHLADGQDAEEIPAGSYLFTQGTGDAWRDAAEAVWLESLWQEREFADDAVFVRVLAEETGQVFQIFRKVKGERSLP